MARTNQPSTPMTRKETDTHWVYWEFPGIDGTDATCDRILAARNGTEIELDGEVTSAGPPMVLGHKLTGTLDPGVYQCEAFFTKDGDQTTIPSKGSFQLVITANLDPND